jgi:hypothetical protein
MENEGGGGVIGIGGGMGTGGGSPATRPLGIGQGPTKSKFAKRKKPLVHTGYKKDRKAKVSY